MPDSDLKVRRRIYRAEVGAYLLIVAVGLYGFWAIEQDQRGDEHDQACTEAFLGATVNAADERTTYANEQANANIRLQAAQLVFLTAITKPAAGTDDRGEDPDDSGDVAFREYLKALREYNRLTTLTAGKTSKFPYPTAENYRTCLKGGE